MKLSGESMLRDTLAQLLYEEAQLKEAAAARDEAQKRYWHAQARRNKAMQRAASALQINGNAVTYHGHRFERLGLHNVRVTPADTELRIEQDELPLREVRR